MMFTSSLPNDILAIRIKNTNYTLAFTTFFRMFFTHPAISSEENSM